VLIGGGGGGGSKSNNYAGGGGGAGGVIWKNDHSVLPGEEYGIDVGSGGSKNQDGEPTIFSSITAIGGGAGAAQYQSGNDGGSGGGGHGYSYFGGSGSYSTDGDPDSYGNDGGYGDTSGGGGGGAGGPGGNGAFGSKGAGGQGITIWGKTYAEGGDGGFADTYNRKDGYGGNGGQPASGSTGGNGIVLLRYPTMNQGSAWPTHGTSNYDPQPTCTISPYNEEGPMTVTFAENSTGEWVTRKVVTDVENDTTSWKYTQATALNTTHWWRVSVDNGTVNLTKIYNFTTDVICINNFTIAKNAHIHRDDAQWWNISIADESGSFNWSIETAPDIGSAYGNLEGNGTKSCQLDGLYYSTTYTVYVNVTGSQLNESYTFSTQSGPEDRLAIKMNPGTEANISLDINYWIYNYKHRKYICRCNYKCYRHILLEYSECPRP